MPIVVNLDVMLARRKMRLNELADRVGITAQNLSVLKTGRARAIRFSTLEKLCEVLDCQPGDLFAFENSAADAAAPTIRRGSGSLAAASDGHATAKGGEQRIAASSSPRMRRIGFFRDGMHDGHTTHVATV